MSSRGSARVALEYARASDDAPETHSFADVSDRMTLFLMLEGGFPGAGEALFEVIRDSLRKDQGTPSSRLLRAVREGCRHLERQSLHRFELAGLGLSALLVEKGAAYLTQLLPSQAYVIEDGSVRAVPEVPMRGAARVASQGGRRWEVEMELSRYAVTAGTAYVLCTSALAERLTSAKLLDAARRPAGDAVGALLGGATRGGVGRDEVLVVRCIGAPEQPRARLFPIRERRAVARPAPLLPPRASGPRIETWGLAGDSRTALRGRLGDPLPAVGNRRRSRRGLWLTLPALAAAGIGGRALWTWRQGQSPAAAPSSDPPPGSAPTAPPGGATAASLLVSDAEPFVSLAVSNGVPRVLDSAGRIAQPGVPPAALAGVGQLVALAARETDAIALDSARTVWRLGEATEAPRALALRAASLWQRPRAIAAYAGNLYVLDAGSPGSGGQIWRHSAGPSGGFDGDAQAWIAPNAGVNLDGATAMAIDGAIWISREDGGVLRLASGRPEPFELRGLETPVRVAGAIYTNVALASIYLLDAAERRLLKIAKTGQLEGTLQEVIPLGESARGLWVEESGRRALVLTDRRLQDVPLV